MEQHQPVLIHFNEAQTYIESKIIEAKVLVDGQSANAKNVSVGWITFPPHSQINKHTRTVEEIIVVTKGTTVILIAGREYVLKKGDAIYMPPGTEHQHTNPTDEPLEQIYIFAPPGPEAAVRKWPTS